MWNTTSREIVNNIIDSITSNIVRHGVVRRKNGEEEVDEGKDVVEGEEVEEGEIEEIEAGEEAREEEKLLETTWLSVSDVDSDDNFEDEFTSGVFEKDEQTLMEESTLETKPTKQIDFQNMNLEIQCLRRKLLLKERQLLHHDREEEKGVTKEKGKDEEDNDSEKINEERILVQHLQFEQEKSTLLREAQHLKEKVLELENEALKRKTIPFGIKLRRMDSLMEKPPTEGLSSNPNIVEIDEEFVGPAEHLERRQMFENLEISQKETENGKLRLEIREITELNQQLKKQLFERDQEIEKLQTSKVLLVSTRKELMKCLEQHWEVVAEKERQERTLERLEKENKKQAASIKLAARLKQSDGECYNKLHEEHRTLKRINEAITRDQEHLIKEEKKLNSQLKTIEKEKNDLKKSFEVIEQNQRSLEEQVEKAEEKFKAENEKLKKNVAELEKTILQNRMSNTAADHTNEKVKQLQAENEKLEYEKADLTMKKKKLIENLKQSKEESTVSMKRKAEDTPILIPSKRSIASSESEPERLYCICRRADDTGFMM